MAAGEALDHVTVQNIIGWFNHGGLLNSFVNRAGRVFRFFLDRGCKERLNSALCPWFLRWPFGQVRRHRGNPDYLSAQGCGTLTRVRQSGRPRQAVARRGTA